MKVFSVLALCLLCFACSAGGGDTQAPDIIIRNVSIVSPEREEPSTPTDVRLRGARIAEIGFGLKAENATVVDGTGRYLTPGLIDSHVHLQDIPGMTYDQTQSRPDIADAARKQIPLSYLYFGFTTVVDLNSGPDFIGEWNAQAVRPQAYFCGGAPIMDGYPTRFIPKPVRYEIMPYFLVEDGATPDGIDATKHAPAAVAEEIRKADGICVKTFYEDGFGDQNNWPTPSVELIRNLVQEAHARDMPVLIHANAEDSQAFAVDAGVDAFVHGMWTWNDDATELTESVAAIVDRTVAEDVAMQPTVQVLYGERDRHDPDYLSMPALADAMPREVIDWYGSEDGQTLMREIEAIPFVASILENEGWQALDAAPLARVNAATRYFHERNGRLLFGSDTPSDVTYANPPGLNGRIEITRWIEIGISPREIFEAATIGNAKFFGLDEEIGTVEPGKKADLLILAQNPLETIEAYDAIETVISGGAVIPRAELSARNASGAGE